MKILCTADIHIGRRSSRLPGASSADHSCADAWLRIVDHAIQDHVDVVAICGDLVDEANRYFEAFGVVDRGLRRLREAAIEVVLVAGNHDHEVLPRLIDGIALDGVHLLGREGRWELLTVERDGERCHFVGWSFPTGRYPNNPLASLPALPTDGGPVVCLLHADLDVPRSPYAPISTAELRSHSDALFLLGHVHGPRWIEEPGGATAVYPGSPQAMDAAEPGSHGFTIVEVGGEDRIMTPVPVSTVRYERIDVDVSESRSVEDIKGLVVESIRERAASLASEETGLRHLHCRIRLTGSTDFHRELDDRFADQVRELDTEVGPIQATVERVIVATRPARDLEAIRSIKGAPGVLAGLILDYETGTLDAADERLLRDAVSAAQSVYRSSTYLPVLEQSPESADEEVHVRGEIVRAANLLLDEMLAQKDPA